MATRPEIPPATPLSRCITISRFRDLPLLLRTEMKPIVQISLDLTDITEALETARMALRAGVDWLEAGTPLLLAEGLHGVRVLFFLRKSPTNAEMLRGIPG